MTTQKPVQPLPEVLLASIRINISSTGRTSVIYESGEQQSADISAKKITAPEQEASSRVKRSGAPEKAKQGAKSQLDPSDEGLQAEISKRIQATKFDSKDAFEPDVSDGLYRKIDGEKTHFITEEYFQISYRDQKVRDRVLALMKRLGWIISGPHELTVHGRKCPMYKINIMAIRGSK